METRGLGAGSYPEPPEPKEKEFIFAFAGSFYGHGVVFAKNEEQAYELIGKGEYENKEIEVTEITDIFDVKEI